MNPAQEPVVVSDDERLLAAVGRSAAAAGVHPLVCRDHRTALASWAGAPVVLLGADQVAGVAAQALVPRSSVVVVCASPPDRSVLRDALACGAVAVLELPADEARLVDLLTDSADGAVVLGRVVGVVGGTGGAGATTFAAALAIELARRAGTSLLIDADAAGGGVDQVLGLPPGRGVRWDALAQATGRLSARSLHETLPSAGAVSVVAWPADRGAGLVPETARTVLSAGRRGYPGVVVDLPRASASVLDELVPRCDQVVMVSTATVPALAACLLLAERLPEAGTSVLLRGRRGVEPPDVERLLGLPVWHRMADQRGLDEAVALGLGPLRSGRGPLAVAARRVADRVGGR